MSGRLLEVVSGAAPEGCSEQLEFEGASTVAQIIQGVAFMSLAIFLLFANNAKLGSSSKAPLEERYNTACTIASAIALFSGFFNILQMTGLDNFDLPRSTSYTLDLARPVEWLLTCPLIQLSLVIIGGARIPSYRKFMMPLLSASTLLCGTAAMFSSGGMQWAWFGFGFVIFLLFTYYNIQQIYENSDGEESFFKGASDYRALSVIVIVTWGPFPMWFILSPEGVGVIQDIQVIQLGWAILNVVSKFGYICHLQYVKTKYCRKLEATRELYAIDPLAVEGAPAAEGGKLAKGDLEDRVGDQPGDEMQIQTLIKETMVSLGLTSHCERFLKLMLDAGITSTDILERVTQDRAHDLNLPWSLVDAVSKRWKSEKMELGQDQGGLIMEDPFKKMLAEGKARHAAKVSPNTNFGNVPDMSNFYAPALPGSYTPPVAPNFAAVMSDSRAGAMEEQMAVMMDKLDSMANLIQSVNQKVEFSQEALSQRMDFSQVSLLQSVNSSQMLLHKLDSSQETVMQQVASQKDVLQKVSNVQDKLLDTITGSSDSAKQDLLTTVANSSDALLKKLDASQELLMKKQGESLTVMTEVRQSQQHIASKMDSNQELTARYTVEAESRLDSKLNGVTAELTNVCKMSANDLSTVLHKDMSTVARQNEATIEVLEKGMAGQEERMADVRRQSMMVMDMLTTTQERVMGSADTIESFARSELHQPTQSDQSAMFEVQIRGILSSEMGRLQKSLQETLLGSEDVDEAHSSVGQPGVKNLLGSMVERLEAASRRLEESACSESGATSVKGGSLTTKEVEEVVRSEMAAMALALAQQQRDLAEENAGKVASEVGSTVRGELLETNKQLQSIERKVDEFEGTIEQSMGRFEQRVEKVVASSAGQPGADGSHKEPRRKSNTADRG
ncbi:unnamed protein product [Polarella glacialis]|uniref:Uncharacterized protein n=2 Tax=Polarella glacialis TaxID=89957 RepID=A0A813KR45_POLGL|nr:unnamed protein product [Polarella glacialis]CAE8734665.1 unnamed protein product [Polarella glacialis]